jgi:hypothetical protein
MKSFSAQIVHQLSIEEALRGVDYSAPRDEKRLGEGYRRTFDVMKDGTWRTPDEIAKLSGCRLDSALRFMRYAKAQGHQYNKRYKENGVYEYQIIPLNN